MADFASASAQILVQLVAKFFPHHVHPVFFLEHL